MGSVSSLITNDELNSKHCKASELRLKNRANQPRRNGGCSLDDLLKCSFTQASSSLPPSPAHLPKGISHSRSGRSEDFFYIKVGSFPGVYPLQKHSATAWTASSAKWTNQRVPTSDTTFKNQSPTFLSGNLSDSGRNSMSSLPTHSTSGSLSACTGPVSHSDGSSAPANCLLKGAHLSPGGLSSKAQSDGGSPLSSHRPKRLSETVGGSRSPLTTDESLIETLEQRLLERENELQELQVRIWLSSRLVELIAAQRATFLWPPTAAKHCSCLHLAQAENEKLKEDLAALNRERDLIERRLSAYEEENTQLAPTLEETQWEVCQKAGEISLLKQQLRDSQEDVSHKLNEIVGLRAQLKEITAKAEMLKEENKDGGDRLRSRTIQVCQNELQRKKNEADLLREKVGQLEKDFDEKQVTTVHKAKEEPVGQTPSELLHKEVERLKRQLGEEKAAQERLAITFDQERRTWNKEKDKVIKYQKQLQINYLQVHKKNQDLERLMKELNAELEARAGLALDLKYSSGLQTYDDVIATEI
uniref:Leucine zipper tumor suppressor 1 n=1 Tax=Hippocampus comes TaxID=109280 RepID=A0A3Q2YKD7_HIPCM